MTEFDKIRLSTAAFEEHLGSSKICGKKYNEDLFSED